MQMIPHPVLIPGFILRVIPVVIVVLILVLIAVWV